MKKFLVRAITLLLALAGPAWAYDDLLATVTGEVDFNSGINGNDLSHAHVQATKISNKRLTEEFGLLTGDYALVLSQTDNALEFIPRSASSGLAKVVIFTFGGNSAGAIESDTGVDKIQEDITSSSDADGTYFEAAVGRVVGKVTFKPKSLVDASTAVLIGWDLTLYATGHASSTSPPLTMHIVTGDTFTQAP